MNLQRRITIRDLYPQMSDEELSIAEANLKRYVAVIVRIYDRLKSEGKSWPAPTASPDLTLPEDDFTIYKRKVEFPEKRN